MRLFGRIFFSFNALILLSSLASFAAEEPVTVVQRLSLPSGDVEAGRRTFQELKCNLCHRIAGDATMVKPLDEKLGPVLGLKQSNYKVGFIAESIIFPSHAVVPGFKDKIDAPRSRMGDFSDTMTVRQLADLVAYLKSLDEEV